MTTYSTQGAKAGITGAYDVRGVGPGDGLRVLNFQIEATAAQLVTGNIFRLVRLEASTVVLGGWISTDTLDSGGTAMVLDVGYYTDGAFGDDDNFWYDGSATAAITQAQFIAGLGVAAAPKIFTEDYDLAITVTTQPTTAAAGTIFVSFVVCTVDSVNEALA